VDVPSGTGQLKVTVVWTDYPGTPLAQKELVNDLDLIAISPNGTRFYPWTLSSSNPSANAVRTAEDHANNVEQLLINTPEAGRWRITVAGTVVPNAPQEYALISNIALQENKGVVPMNTGTPFYTINRNPVYSINQSCLWNMTNGTSCNQSWMVNATGNNATSWSFYALYHSVDYASNVPSNQTTPINITILEGAQTSTISHPLFSGWNLFGVSVNVTNVNASRALSLCGCGRVARYANIGDGNALWEEYYTSPVSGGTDFNLTLGSGYFVKCDSSSALNLTGSTVSSLNSTVHYDWNILAWTNTSGSSNASRVLNNITGAYRIARYANNGTSAVWEEYYSSPVSGGTDFTVNHTEGYFIKASQNSSWIR
jgi:hypothetical protein